VRLFVVPEDGKDIIDDGAARVITSMDMDEKTGEFYKGVFKKPLFQLI
jgi:hypothetical protein